MAQKSTREGLKKEYVDYLGNLIIGGKIKKDITDLIENVLNMDLLWTNTSPSSPFSAQAINLDLSRYNKIAVVFYYDVNLQYISDLCFFEKVNIPQRISEVFDQWGIARIIISITDTSVNFGAAVQTAISDATYTTVSNRMIPYKIYGVK